MYFLPQQITWACSCACWMCTGIVLLKSHSEIEFIRVRTTNTRWKVGVNPREETKRGVVGGAERKTKSRSGTERLPKTSGTEKE